MAEETNSTLPIPPFPFSALDKLNACANSETPGYVKFDDLELDEPYKIQKFGVYKSTNFDKEKTHLTVYIDQGYLILPDRFNTLVAEAEKLNCENLYIVFKGREYKKGGDIQRLMIEFKEM